MFQSITTFKNAELTLSCGKCNQTKWIYDNNCDTVSSGIEMNGSSNVIIGKNLIVIKNPKNGIYKCNCDNIYDMFTNVKVINYKYFLTEFQYWMFIIYSFMQFLVVVILCIRLFCYNYRLTDIISKSKL